MVDSCIEKNTKVAVANVRAKCESDEKCKFGVMKIEA